MAASRQHRRCLVPYLFTQYQPFGRVTVSLYLIIRKRELIRGVDGFEYLVRWGCAWADSLNHQWRGTKWSDGPGEGLVRRNWRALTGQRTGDFRLPDAGKDRQWGSQTDSLQGLGRDGP